MILIKASILFLLFMVGIAIWGRFRKPKPRKAARFCPACGRPRIGKDRCACGAKT
ncbi:hypothetical protein [Rubellimicrobium aerolatum]|uniref:Short-chain dehydrogenase n=1 Tax=Rubellimicrobium aerolatum TaxID=490979 RepID=A0ABW0SFN0_9RHOB|nr:hypothetical protein [Rubellimicrobium aerolatum]MBP1806380.1 hypothetical protein [Rubellimicrobium aerolatum]